MIMSLFQDENGFLISDDDMELDEKVNEETFVNLECVKKEEPDFEGISNINPYEIKIKFENLFEENPEENPGNKSNSEGVLNDDITIEEGIVKLENIKDEDDSRSADVKHFSCDKCAGNYEGYCPNCSSLLHILNNNVILDLNTGLDINTIPKNVLEIRNVSKQKKVFALKTVQKGVTFGPFEGVSPVECTNGFVWKIKEWKFSSERNGNWMKHVACASNRFCKNIDIFRRDSDIYFQTSRKIKDGEELLIHYSDEVMLSLDNAEECYFVPEEKKESPKIFACRSCCLGFRLESCLVEHKSKCPSWDRGRNNEDFEIVECSFCKMWLEKQEHLSSHMSQCLENHKRKLKNSLKFQPMKTDEVDESDRTDEAPTVKNENSNDSENTIITNSTEPQAVYSLYSDLYWVDAAEKNDGDDETNTNSNTIAKRYNCPICFYQTNYKGHLNSHANIHDAIKRFECYICKKRFTQKGSLNVHIQCRHSSTSEKRYKCSECFYQTTRNSYLKRHMYTHSDIKPFECNICKKGFTKNSNLKVHIQSRHSSTSEKRYKCSECFYQAHSSSNLKVHLNTHSDIKPFECEICKQSFNQKGNLKRHVQNQHSNTGEKE